MLQQGALRLVALAAAAVLLGGSVVVGALVLLAPGSTPGSGTATGPSSAPSAASSAPATPRGSVSVGSVPGANALAVAGTGEGSARFTPAVAAWSVHATYSCQAGSVPFRLVVQDAAGATVLTLAGTTAGDERRAVTGTGAFTLEVSGGCTWSLEATG